MEMQATAEETLYAKYGGEGTIKKLVDVFYEKVLGDPLLSPMFRGVDMARQKRHQALFISQALGGPKKYTGRDMFEAHKNLKVTDEQFDAVAGHLVASMNELGVETADVEQVVAIVAPLKSEIVMTLFERWLRMG